MRHVVRSILVAFLTFCATEVFTACGGLLTEPEMNAGSGHIQKDSVDVVHSLGGVGITGANEHIGSLNQGLYTGPSLKLPLPPGYAWRVNTEAGTGYCGPGCTDTFHTSAGYYSIDFGRYVQDVVGGNASGTSVDNSADGGVVDILAAAKGKVMKVTNSNCYKGGDYDHTCKVLIEHDSTGYVTEYLHFKAGTITVNYGDLVAQGKILGKMGTTGDSTGVHLHFQVRYGEPPVFGVSQATYSGTSVHGNKGLSGITLEGLDFFTGFKYGKFISSSNGFGYNPTRYYGANPRTCKNLPTLQNGDYTCTQQSVFQTYRTVFGDVYVSVPTRELCFKTDVQPEDSSTSPASSEWCSSGAPSYSGFYLMSGAWSTVGGARKMRFFVRTKDSADYLPAPMGVVSFTVLGQTSQPAPTITNPANWVTIHLADSLRWNDAPPYAVTDHDLYFWTWDGSAWQPFGLVYAWVPTSMGAFVPGLPTYKWVAWTVRSCNSQTGCSGFSPYSYFSLLP